MKAYIMSIALAASLALFGAEPQAALSNLGSLAGDCREIALRFYNSVR